MSNLPSPEDLMRRACEVRDEDQQQANTARRVGALLADLVTAVSSALPLTSWRVTRSKSAVSVEYAVPVCDGTAVTLRVEIPAATVSEAGLMTAADKVKVDGIPQPQSSSQGSGKTFVYSPDNTNDARCVMTMRNTDISQNAGKLHFRRGYWSTAAEGEKYITREIPAATANSDGVMPKEVFGRLGTGASLYEGTPTATQVPVVYPNWAAGGTRSFTLGAATSARAGLMTAADKRLLGSIIHLGTFASKDAACNYAARAEVAGNRQAALLLFTATGATGAQLEGRIYQMVNGENVSMQLLMWDKRQYRRNVTGATGRAGDSTTAFSWEETAPHKLGYDAAARRLSMLSYENGTVGSVTLPQSTTGQDGLMSAADKRRLAETQNLVPEVAAFVENVAIENTGAIGSGRIVFDTGRQRFLFNRQMKYYISIPPAKDPGSVFSSPRTGQLYFCAGEQEGLYRWNGTTLESVAASQTTGPVPIAVGYYEGRLRVYGYEELLEQGYRLCIFRRKKCKREHRSRPGVAPEEEYRIWRLKKGWICYGSPDAVRIAGDGIVEFSTAPLPELKISPESLGHTYSAAPRNSLIRVVTEEDGTIYVQWGGKVWMKDQSRYRILKFPFALGFVREKGYNEAITPADLVSTLAEFSINVQWRGYGCDEDGVKVAFSK